ncbi:DUF2397 family protein [Streptomyces sp. NPDC017529]|uniref:DUF2397 family protein n=1 Tax=Streptomyces sp. NPDC017529 TaxID=3365000 RepID=UPI003795AF19
MLDAFGVAVEHQEKTLGLDSMRERLRRVGWVAAIEDEDLYEALRNLVQWELLDVVHTHAENYRTAEGYKRRDLQYSLTRRGEVALAGVRHALEVVASKDALQTAVLRGDRRPARRTVFALANPASADWRAFSTLRELEGYLDALMENTKAFNGELQRLLRAEGADLEGV